MVLNAFRKPHERLSEAVNRARQCPDRKRAIRDLVRAIDKDEHAANLSGASRVVMISYATLANLYIQEEQFSAAIKTLEKLRDYDREIVLRLGLSLAGCNVTDEELVILVKWFENAGRVKELLPTLSRVVEERFSGHSGLFLLIGDLYFSLNQYQEAAEQYLKVFQLDRALGSQLIPNLNIILSKIPQSLTANHLAGLIHLQLGDEEQATTYLSIAYASGLNDFDSLLHLIDCNIALNQFSNTIDIFDSLIKRYNNIDQIKQKYQKLVQQSSTHDNLQPSILRLGGDILLREGDYKGALSIYQEIFDRYQSLSNEGIWDFSCLIDRVENIILEIDQEHLGKTQELLSRILLKINKPDLAFDACVKAVRHSPILKEQVLDILEEIVSLSPKSSEPAMQLLNWQMDCGFIQNAINTADLIAERYPDSRPSLIPYYQKLLDSFALNEIDRSKQANESLIKHLLYRLAEETAVKSKEESLILFENIVNKYGADEAEKVAASIIQLGLNKSIILQGNLLLGDAYFLSKRYADALKAYQAAAQDSQANGQLTAKLEKLYLIPEIAPQAILLAADLEANRGNYAVVPGLLQKAFQLNPNLSAKGMVDRLFKLYRLDLCPAAGQLLLIDGLLHIGDSRSMPMVYDFLSQLYERDLIPVPHLSSRCSQLLKRVNHESKIYSQTAILLGDILSSKGDYGGAASSYALAIGLPGVDEQKLLLSFQNLAKAAPDHPVVWMCLGDALWQLKIPALKQSIEAYRRSIQVDRSSLFSTRVLESLNNLQSRFPDVKKIIDFNWVMIESQIHAGKISSAVEEMRALLREQGGIIIPDIKKLLINLPVSNSVRFLYAHIAFLSGNAIEAAQFIHQILEDCSDNEVNEVANLAGEWKRVEGFTLKFIPIYILSNIKKGDFQLAEKYLLEALIEHPGLVEPLTPVIEGLSAVRLSLEIILSSARMELARGNVQAAYSSLAKLSEIKNGYSKAQKFIKETIDHHPEDLITAGLKVLTVLLQKPSRYLQICLDEIEKILLGSLHQIDLRLLDQLLDQIEEQIPPTSAGQKIHFQVQLLRTEIAIHVGNIELASSIIKSAYQKNPKEYKSILDICRVLLIKTDSFSLVDLMTEILISQHEYSEALNVLFDENSHDPEILRHKILLGEEIIHQTKILSPQIAATSALNIAAWYAALKDDAKVIQFCQEAVLFDPGRMQDIVGWLRRQAWDAESRKKFLDSATDILLFKAGEPDFDQSIKMYREIIAQNIPDQWQQILEHLEKFPSTYFPAWELRLIILQKREPAGSPELFEALKQVLDIFGQHQSDFVIEFTKKLDRNLPETRETEIDATLLSGDVFQSLSLLSDWLFALPDQKDRVMQYLQLIRQQYSNQVDVLLALCDLYITAKELVEAATILNKSLSLELLDTGKFLERYQNILSLSPKLPEAVWGIANLLARCEKFDEAALYLNQIISIDSPFRNEVESFTSEILKQAPQLSNLWFLRGRIALLHSDWNAAILLFEQTLQKSGLRDEWLPRLYEYLSSAYYSIGDYQKSFDILRIAAKLEPSNNDLRQKIVNVHLKVIEERISTLSKEIEANPSNIDLYSQLGESLLLAGRSEDGIRILQKGIEIKPDKGKLYQLIGQGFSAMRMYPLAAASYHSALQANDLPVSDRKTVMFKLAYVYIQMDNISTALSILERLLAMDYSYEGAYNLWMKLRNSQESTIKTTLYKKFSN